MNWRNKLPEIMYRSLISLIMLMFLSLYFYLLGTFQSFQEEVVKQLFVLTTWICWVSLCLAIMLTGLYIFKKRSFHHKLFITILSSGFSLIIFFMLQFIKVWVYN